MELLLLLSAHHGRNKDNSPQKRFVFCCLCVRNEICILHFLLFAAGIDKRITTKHQLIRRDSRYHILNYIVFHCVAAAIFHAKRQQKPVVGIDAKRCLFGVVFLCVALFWIMYYHLHHHHYHKTYCGAAAARSLYCEYFIYFYFPFILCSCPPAKLFQLIFLRGFCCFIQWNNKQKEQPTSPTTKAKKNLITFDTIPDPNLINVDRTLYRITRISTAKIDAGHTHRRNLR